MLAIVISSHRCLLHASGPEDVLTAEPTCTVC